MKAKTQLPLRTDPLPLQKEERTEVDAETGGVIKVVQLQRGILKREIRTYDPHSFFLRARGPHKTTREAFEDFANGLRDDLERRDIPSDRTPVWIKEADGDWRPKPEEFEGSCRPIAYARWSKRAEDLCEPLSKARSAVTLLEAVNAVLGDDPSEQELFAIWELMEAYLSFRLAGSINLLASQAIKARAARAKGPTAKRERGTAVRQIIMAQAEAYWTERPIFRNSASNTASSIVASVSEELRIAGLLAKNKSEISIKTIADHIRDGIREQKSRTGESGGCTGESGIPNG